MRRGARHSRGFTLIELTLTLGIIGLLLGAAYSGLAATLRASRAWAEEAREAIGRQEVERQIADDLAATSRLVPDEDGMGFLLETPTVLDLGGVRRRSPTSVLYTCEVRKEGPVLVRTSFPGTGEKTPASMRRLAGGVVGCRGEVEGRTWRVRIRWADPQGGAARDTIIEAARRVEEAK